MTYSGEVHVGGPPDTREIDGLTVTKIAVGPMDNNAYLLRCTSTGQGLLIDAANEAGRLIEMIGDTPVGTIVTTHRHFDHWQALPEVQTRTGAVVVAHPADADELPVQVGHRAEHGEVLTFGDCAVSLIHLRGHTPGSLAVLYDAGGRLSDAPHVFTGDSLFPGGVGKTNSAGGLQLAAHRRDRTPVRPAPRRDLGVSGARQGYDARRRAPAPWRVARTRLVSPRSLDHSASAGSPPRYSANASARAGSRSGEMVVITSGASPGSAHTITLRPCPAAG